MRTGYVEPDVFKLLLTALMPANRLALTVSMTTGLRIGDVLHLKTYDILRTSRPTITERKTGKHRRVYFPRALREEMLRQGPQASCAAVPHRRRENPREHRAAYRAENLRRAGLPRTWQP